MWGEDPPRGGRAKPFPRRAPLHRVAVETSPGLVVEAGPVGGRVEGLLGQVDGAGADVLVGLEADLLEHGRERGELDLAMGPIETVAIGPGENVEHLDGDRIEGGRV